MTLNPGEPVFDTARTYPAVAAARAALAAGDWQRLQSVFLAAGSRYEQHKVVQAAWDVPGCENLLFSVWEAGRDPLAGTMLAAREVRLGWDARGDGRGSTVTEAMYRAFRDYLIRAEQRLTEVTARSPGLAAAWALRLTTARGLELAAPEARRRFQRLVATSPHDLVGQESLQQHLLPKWFGDWETATAFTWQCATQAPPGSPNAALVVLLHVERWLESDKKPAAVFADPAVRRDVWQAGEWSVMSPQFSGAPGWEYALSLFALGYSLCEDWGRAKNCFARLGPHAHDAGWSYFAHSEHVFLRAREDAQRLG